MDPRNSSPLDNEIQEVRREITGLESKLAIAKGLLLRLERAKASMSAKVPVAPPEEPRSPQIDPSARAGRGRKPADAPRPDTDVGKSMRAIRSAGHPLYMDDLLTAIGKEVTRENRMSLAGSLGALVRQNKWFYRPQPNTFGLLDMPVQDSQVATSVNVN